VEYPDGDTSLELEVVDTLLLVVDVEELLLLLVELELHPYDVGLVTELVVEDFEELEVLLLELVELEYGVGDGDGVDFVDVVQTLLLDLLEDLDVECEVLGLLLLLLELVEVEYGVGDGDGFEEVFEDVVQTLLELDVGLLDVELDLLVEEVEMHDELVEHPFDTKMVFVT